MHATLDMSIEDIVTRVEVPPVVKSAVNYDGHTRLFVICSDMGRPELRERIFHFSSDSISKLKKKANMEVGKTDKEISSLQTLSALLWRSITRARRLADDQMPVCSLDAGLNAKRASVAAGVFWEFNMGGQAAAKT